MEKYCLIHVFMDDYLQNTGPTTTQLTYERFIPFRKNPFNQKFCLVMQAIKQRQYKSWNYSQKSLKDKKRDYKNNKKEYNLE